MSYARKNSRNVAGSIIGVLVVAAIAVWQFYQFATFANTGGANGSQGAAHLWIAILFSVFACGAGFLLFSVFLHHDDDDDLHITAPPKIKQL